MLMRVEGRCRAVVSRQWCCEKEEGGGGREKKRGQRDCKQKSKEDTSYLLLHLSPLPPLPAPPLTDLPSAAEGKVVCSAVVCLIMSNEDEEGGGGGKEIREMRWVGTQFAFHTPSSVLLVVIVLSCFPFQSPLSFYSAPSLLLSLTLLSLTQTQTMTRVNSFLLIYSACSTQRAFERKDRTCTQK